MKAVKPTDDYCIGFRCDNCKNRYMIFTDYPKNFKDILNHKCYICECNLIEES